MKRNMLARGWRMMTLVLLLALVAPFGFSVCAAVAQEAAPESAENAAGPTAEEGPVASADEAEDTPAPKPPPSLTLFNLLALGGPLMIPLYVLSIVSVAATIERILGLRRSKVMPSQLVDALGQLAASPSGFDPRKAYRICQQYPSTASTVIRAMLLKVGRPHSEVEHAVAETSEREATRLYSNVRWLTLTAAIAPLMGLFGTVWGMIMCFHELSSIAPGVNPREQLAQGIYVALITTLGGLAVAIPAAMVAHFFEGRIQNLFHQIDELLFSLMPQVERFEGRLRVSRQSLGADEASPPPPAPEPARAPAPAAK